MPMYGAMIRPAISSITSVQKLLMKASRHESHMPGDGNGDDGGNGDIDHTEETGITEIATSAAVRSSAKRVANGQPPAWRPRFPRFLRVIDFPFHNLRYRHDSCARTSGTTLVPYSSMLFINFPCGIVPLLYLRSKRDRPSAVTVFTI